MVPFWAGRCVDAVPLPCVRFFRLGNMGSSVLRRTLGDSSLRGQSVAERILQVAGEGARHGSKSNPLCISTAHPGRGNWRSRRQSRPSFGHLRWRSPRIAELKALDQASRRYEPSTGQHVWHYGNHGACYVSADSSRGCPKRTRECHRCPDTRSAGLRAGSVFTSSADRGCRRAICRRCRSRSRVSQPSGID